MLDDKGYSPRLKLLYKTVIREALKQEYSYTNDMQIPHLVSHGSDDPTVLIDEAKNIIEWNSAAELHIIKDANHVFDGCHPFNSDVFPKDLQEAIDVTIKFLKDN